MGFGLENFFSIFLSEVRKMLFFLLMGETKFQGRVKIGKDQILTVMENRRPSEQGRLAVLSFY